MHAYSHSSRYARAADCAFFSTVHQYFVIETSPPAVKERNQ